MMDILGPRMVWQMVQQGEVDSIKRANWPQRGLCLMESIRWGTGGCKLGCEGQKGLGLRPIGSGWPVAKPLRLCQWEGYGGMLVERSCWMGHSVPMGALS